MEAPEAANERAKLLTCLRKAMSDPEDPFPKGVDSAVWACLWFADLEKIRVLVSKAEKGGHERTLAASPLYDAKKMLEQIKFWTTCRKPKMEDPPGTDTPSSSKRRKTENSRSKTARENCLDRDKKFCVLTRAGEPIEAAHIYPYSMGKQAADESTSLFWSALRNFWSEEEIRAWMREVTGPDGTETCANLITLCSHAHALWDKGRFAIQPLEVAEDGKSLTAKFFWFKHHEYQKRISIDEVPDFPYDLRSGPMNTKLCDCDTEKMIISGHDIIFKTEDPVAYPLPSKKILEMQWILNRVLALSGAADLHEEDFDPDLGFDLVRSWTGLEWEASDDEQED